MNTAHQFTKLRFLGAFLVVAVSLVYGCTLSSVQDDLRTTISEDDIHQASNILGESLSEDNSGVMLSIRDAMSIASDQGISSIGDTQTDSNSNSQIDRSGRGNELNYSHRYESSTGRHIVSFKRLVDLSLFSKEVSDTLNYTYKTESGSFIRYPAENRGDIYSIFYAGSRSGRIQEADQTTHFTRKDTFAVNNISGPSPVITLDGVHSEEGIVIERQPDGSVIEQDYRLEFNFLNMEIQKSTLSNGILYRNLTGILSWEMHISKQADGTSESKRLQGTIILNGDGTGQLRFQEDNDRYHVNLNSGEVNRQDQSFEGEVKQADPLNQTLTLISGRTLYLTDSTEVEGDEGLKSVGGVRAALQRDERVWAEGEGFIERNKFHVKEVEFEQLEEDDQQENSIEFEARVTAVNVVQQTFTLSGGVKILVDDQTSVENEGDFNALAELKEAVTMGTKVKAEGEAVELSADANADLRALEVKFEMQESGENGNDGQDNLTIVSFEGEVEKIEPENMTMTLRGGRTLYLNDSTDIEGEENLGSLGNVQSALQGGSRIWAEGKGFNQDNQFHVTEVVFSEQGEDDQPDDSQPEYIDFEGMVTSVDVLQHTFTLDDSLSVLVNNQTHIDSSGTFVDLAEVGLAITSGEQVSAEGDAVELSSNGAADLRAVEVSFEQ